MLTLLGDGESEIESSVPCKLRANFPESKNLSRHPFQKIQKY